MKLEPKNEMEWYEMTIQLAYDYVSKDSSLMRHYITINVGWD